MQILAFWDRFWKICGAKCYFCDLQLRSPSSGKWRLGRLRSWRAYRSFGCLSRRTARKRTSVRVSRPAVWVAAMDLLLVELEPEPEPEPEPDPLPGQDRAPPSACGVSLDQGRRGGRAVTPRFIPGVNDGSPNVVVLPSGSSGDCDEEAVFEAVPVGSTRPPPGPTVGDARHVTPAEREGHNRSQTDVHRVTADAAVAGAAANKKVEKSSRRHSRAFALSTR